MSEISRQQETNIAVGHASTASGIEKASRGFFTRPRVFLLAVLVLALSFCVPLGNLVLFAAHSPLFSYILLIPAVSLYLAWPNRRVLDRPGHPARICGSFFLLAGGALIGGFVWTSQADPDPWMEDYLAWTIGSFYLLFVGIFALVLGKEALRAFAFPLALLVFSVPFPLALQTAIETGLQYSSAATACGMLWLARTHVELSDLLLTFNPDLHLKVAPECSGIHSTLVLLITSLVAGQVLLRTPWKRAVLVLAVVPLGILRNGFRIFTLGELALHISPKILDSWIHRRGGPLFFLVSLVPLFLLLVWLRKSESRNSNPSSRAIR